MKFARAIIVSLLLSFSCYAAVADEVIVDDLIVVGSECLGLDCNLDEEFAFSTLKLKENNLRIFFHDTSKTGSFPTNDWEIIANDSANGGASFFGIADRLPGWPTVSGGEPATQARMLVLSAQPIVNAPALVTVELLMGNHATLVFPSVLTLAAYAKVPASVRRREISCLSSKLERLRTA